MLGTDPIITRIVIQRNQSLDLAGFAGFLALSFVPQFVFLLFAALIGWWPVVGFVGAAFLLLAGLLYAVMASARTREVITVSARQLVVEYGRGRPQWHAELDRYWARVERREDRQRLMLCSRGVAIEVGGMLTASERETLARRLAELVGPSALPAGAVSGRSAVATV